MATFSGHMPTFDDMLRFAVVLLSGRAPLCPAGPIKRQEEMIKAVRHRELSRKAPVYLGIGRLHRWKLRRACAHVE